MGDATTTPSSRGTPRQPPPARPRFVPVVGPRLKIVLTAIFVLFALLAVNSAYLGGITFLEWRTGLVFQNYFYLWMFLAHLGLGLAITLPVIGFGLLHARNANNRPNTWAKRVGWALFIAALVVLGTGFLLTRFELGGLKVGITDPGRRNIAYWLHILAPIAVVWLFVLHRLAGRRIKWRIGVACGGVAALFAFGMAYLHSLDPRDPDRPGPKSGEAYYMPSLARTANGTFIPAQSMLMNDYCLECHQDTYESWSHSVHARSSFNNPLYAFAVRETRRVSHAASGNVRSARFCAGCHDPVPFFSGAFEEPKWDDPDYDVARDPLGSASLTCMACHSIVHVGSTRGNADYTIEESPQYPFTGAESPVLRWVNRQLIKSKPAFHKRTFMKPAVHRTTEFCSTCHKVNLPQEINDYKWLRGQNHYDSFRLSGVSGFGVVSWYYPPKPEADCNGCHMQAIASEEFGSKIRDGKLTVRDHSFLSANPALAHLEDAPDKTAILKQVEEFNKGVMRVDVVGLREGGTIDGSLHAPLRPELPVLEPGKRYLLDVVTRTVKMGHEFTQGTADSNEIWLDVTVRSGDRVIGRSGGFGPGNEVDPWSKFLNVFMLDREGNRIDRRNPQDIFVPLYNNQVPPGAADLTQFVLQVPDDATAPIEVDVALRYRKFDTTFMRYVFGPSRTNDLPILTLATDRIAFPVRSAAGVSEPPAGQASAIEPWQRWYDYGIGLFRTADRGAGRGLLRQAEDAFAAVEKLGRPEGPLGRARVQIREGRLDEASEALHAAASGEKPAYPWSIAWFSGQVAKQQGNLDEAIELFRSVVAGDWQLAKDRGFDFSRDDRVRLELAETLLERARLERGDGAAARREAFLAEAEKHLLAANSEDSENANTHYLLAQVALARGDQATADAQLALHAYYKVDDNARDRAINLARIRYPAANKAAEAVVLYDLARPGAFELPAGGDPRISSNRPSGPAPARAEPSATD